MLVTLLGIVTEVRPEQPENALLPMLVTLLGIVTEVRPEQPENALLPMFVTLFGIIVFLQPKTKVLVVVSIMALQLSRESYTAFPEATLIEAKLSQPRNAISPMLVTLFPIVTEVRPEQLENILIIDNQRLIR